MRAGIVIIGGNAMGVWAAAELAHRADPLRAPVVVLEAGDFEAAAPAMTPILPGTAADGGLRGALIDGERALARFEIAVGRGIGHGRPGLLDWTGPVDGVHGEAPPAHALGLTSSLLKEALWHPAAGVLHATRLHSEVLALARTRGVITRPQIVVDSVEFDPISGQVCAIETNGGRYETRQVLICDGEAAGRLTPQAARGLTGMTRVEWSFASPDFDGGATPLGGIRGSTQGLFDTDLEVATGDPFRTFFGGDGVLEYPYPSLRTSGFETIPNPLDGCLVAARKLGEQPDGERLRQELIGLAPGFASLGGVELERRVAVTTSLDGLPVVGPVPGQAGLFVALGLGVRAAQVAAGLAPGIAAQMRGEVTAAFNAELLAVRG